MSKRAKLRRQEREKLNKTKTYTLTQAQIEQMKYDMYKEMYKDIYQETHDKVYEEALDTSYGMMLNISAYILALNHWKKSADRRIPEFLDNCIDIYQRISSKTIDYTDIISEVEKSSKKRMDLVKQIREFRKHEIF